jgi:capsular polysaccharide biosynthesis protein
MISSQARPATLSPAPGQLDHLLGLDGRSDIHGHGDIHGHAYDASGYESIGRSAMRHPVLVGIVAVVGLLTGVVAGYEHPPTYTSDAQLIVGRTASLSIETIPGLDVAVQSLASDYARLITSTNVISDAEGYLHSSQLPGTLSASPIPESSIIDVRATASSKALALDLANAGARALTNVVTQITNDTQAELAPILASYQKADATAEAATVQAGDLQDQLDDLIADVGKDPPTYAQTAEEDLLSRETATELTKADTAKLGAQNYLSEYDNAVPPYQTQEEMVQRVGQATYSGSNQVSTLEAAGLGGAVGGLVIGLALAVWSDSRKARRRAKFAS